MRTLLTLLVLLSAVPTVHALPAMSRIALATSAGGDGNPAEPASCGDEVCDEDETCVSCEADCGACPPEGEMYPGTGWDLDATETEINAIRASLGTDTRPVVPTLPIGALTPVSVDTDAEFETAAAGDNQEITLAADIGNVCVEGTDIRINLAGFEIELLQLGCYGSGTAARIHVVGPGTAGQVMVIATGFGAVEDVLIDGLFISPDFFATPDDTPAVYLSGDGVSRFGLIHSILRGQSGAYATTNCSLMIGDDIVFYDVNCGAGLDSIGVNDVWGVRLNPGPSGTSRFAFVDSRIQSEIKPPIRTGGDEPGIDGRLIYTTPDNRATSRRTTFVDLHSGNGPAAIPAGFGFIVNRNHAELYTSWYVAEGGGAVAQLWGPATAGGYHDYLWVMGGIDITATDDTMYSAAIFSAREAFADGDEVWDLDAVGGTPNTFTYEADVSAVVPAWPTITGGASAGTSFTVGSDPYAAPP